MPQYSWFKIRKGRGSFFYVATWHRASWLLFLYFVVAMTSALAQTSGTVPNVEAIVARMAQARAENRTRLRPYIVTRNYKLFGKEESKAKSEVVADVAFVPPDSKEYTIQETNGSGLGQVIVRRVLANEAEVTKDYSSTDISADNYDFRFMREADVNGQRCYMLELLPRREEKHLLQGDIWVDANTYLLRRFEGELAKPPSWWVRDVGVTFVYGDVGNVAADGFRSPARVRVLGPAKMVSRDVKYKITEQVAAASLAQTTYLELMPVRIFSPGAILRSAN